MIRATTGEMSDILLVEDFWLTIVKLPNGGH
jgi:hypothetical protein